MTFIKSFLCTYNGPSILHGKYQLSLTTTLYVLCLIFILQMTKMRLRKIKELLENFNLSLHILKPKHLASHLSTTMGEL